MLPFPDTSVVRTRCYSSSLCISPGALLLDCQAELSSETTSVVRRYSPVSVLLNCESTTRETSMTSAPKHVNVKNGRVFRKSREESLGHLWKAKKSLSLSLFLSSSGNWLTQYYNNKHWQAAQHHCTLVVSELWGSSNLLGKVRTKCIVCYVFPSLYFFFSKPVYYIPSLLHYGFL